MKSLARALAAVTLAACGGTADNAAVESPLDVAVAPVAELPKAQVETALPSDARELINLAFTRHDNGEYAAAVKLFQKAGENYPLARSLAARSMLEEGRVKEAYTQAVEVARCFDVPLAHFVVGLVASRDGRMDEAMEAYKHVLDLDPSDAAAHNNLGGLYYHRENFYDARHETEVALEFANDPQGQSIAESNLAELDALGGDLKSAEERLDRALELTPDLAHPYYEMAVIYDLTGRQDAAITMARQAVDLDLYGEVRRAISFVWPELEWQHDAIIAEARGDYDTARDLWTRLAHKEAKSALHFDALRGRADAHLARLDTSVREAIKVEAPFADAVEAAREDLEAQLAVHTMRILTK